MSRPRKHRVNGAAPPGKAEEVARYIAPLSLSPSLLSRATYDSRPRATTFLLPFIESDIQIFLQRFAHRGISRYPVSRQVDLIGRTERVGERGGREGGKRGERERVGGYSAALEALSIRTQRRSN